jgi:hypothetical protein
LRNRDLHRQLSLTASKGGTKGLRCAAAAQTPDTIVVAGAQEVLTSSSTGSADSVFQDLGFENATLLYVSDATFPLCDVERMVERSAAWNHRQGLTGLLCFDGAHFLQYIEGPAEPLHTLYKLLRTDFRHENMDTLMLARCTDVLRFSTWSMAYVHCPDEHHTIPTLRGSRSAQALAAFEELLARATAERFARG